MMKDVGRVASPNRLSSTTEPQERLGPSGFDPARCETRPCVQHQIPSGPVFTVWLTEREEA